MRPQRRKKMIFLTGLFLVCFFGSFLLGKYPIDPWTVIKIILSRLFSLDASWTTRAETVIFYIRLPRVIMAAVVGAGLSCAGAAYQGVFQNPMASPDILGASNGAAFGAALGLTLSLGYRAVTFSAFAFGLTAVSIVCLVGSWVRGSKTLGLILSGIMIGSLFTAGVSFLKLVADPTNTLPVITYWLMGSLASIRVQDALFAGPVIAFGMIPIFLWRWKINVLIMGDEEARTMGVNGTRLRTGIILCATLITAASVSVSGMIGWVGLVIPHFARMFVGNDYRAMLPAAVLMGASFLILVDNVSRMLSTSEIPIGILTAFIGAPFFLYLILREGRGRN